MKKPARKLQLQTQTVAPLTNEILERVQGGAGGVVYYDQRSKTGNCPVGHN